MTSGMVDTARSSIKQLKKELKIIAEIAVQEHSNIIIDMNTETLMHGLDADGEKLTPEYRSDEYAAEKNRMNPLPGEGTPDLFLEGNFHSGFYVKPEKMGWSIDSKDSKRDKLANKYGDDIFGNTKEDEKEINEDYIKPEMIEFSLDNLKM